MPKTGISSEEPVRPEQPGAGDEVVLVRRAQMGSAAAFEQLVVARGPELYRYLAIRLQNDSDARDALQEALTAAWQALPTLKQPGKFWPWLVAIAAHKAADVARSRTPVSTRALDVESSTDMDALDIREALDQLPPRFREVLVLRYGLRLSEQEVAHVLGIRIGTVKSRTARARAALRELME